MIISQLLAALPPGTAIAAYTPSRSLLNLKLAADVTTGISINEEPATVFASLSRLRKRHPNRADSKMTEFWLELMLQIV